MSRPTFAILSTQNLIHNIKVIRQKIGNAKIVAMLKANAYGHGIQSTALILEKEIDLFGVASIDEAIQLREASITSPILLAQGIFEENELFIAADQDFHIAFHNASQVEWLMKHRLPAPIHAWIKINTGLCRLGFNMDLANNMYEKLKNHQQVSSVKIMSHFACANTIEHPQNKKQITLFKEFIKDKKAELSICNSAAIINFPELHYDYVRPGISLYGGSPLDGISAKDLGLKPVMTLQTELMSVQVLPKGSYIGYGARYQCDETMPIGIAACGYGDGYSVSAKDDTPVLVNDIQCRLVGRVSMDMIAIDLRTHPSAKIGDKVTLWGDNLPIEEVANHTSDITWRLLTGISRRVRYVWV